MTMQGKTMRKIALVAMLIAAAGSFAFEVDQAELRKIEGTTVDFINYEGPHERIDSVSEIRGIGEFLGRDASDVTEQFDFYGKYRVIHAAGNGETGLDADIIILEESARVDHIDNLRLIISGYLEAAYEYDRSAADLLAEFVTFYNAIYRGNLEFFQGTYKAGVLEYLTADKVGLAKVYSEWAGRTQIVIPLRADVLGDGPAGLDTDEISNEDVVENLRETDDMGIDRRKELTELKEDEIEEDQARINEERERLEREQVELAEREEALEEDLDAARQAEEDAVAAGDDAAAEAARDEQERIQGEIDETRRDQEDVASAQDRVDDAQDTQREREDRVQEDREGIADDERVILGQEDDTPSDEASVYFLHIADISGEPYGQLLIIGSSSGKILGTSDLNTIRGGKYDELDNSILVLAGRSGGGGAIRLVLLDPDSLAQTVEGTDDIFRDSVVLATGTDIFAVTERSGDYYLARFDKSLTAQAVSEVAVDPFTSLTLTSSTVYAQGTNGDVVLLRRSDLKVAVSN
jgi:hypothetical protein